MLLYNRIIAPLLKHLPHLFLSWALVAVISVVAKDEQCRSLQLGNAEASINLALGTGWKSLVMGLIVFYLVVAVFFAATRRDNRIEELQDNFFRPVAVPVLFQVAGFSGALIAASGASHSGPKRLGFALTIIALSLALHNVAELFRRTISEA